MSSLRSFVVAHLPWLSAEGVHVARAERLEEDGGNAILVVDQWNVVPQHRRVMSQDIGDVYVSGHR